MDCFTSMRKRVLQRNLTGIRLEKAMVSVDEAITSRAGTERGWPNGKRGTIRGQMPSTASLKAALGQCSGPNARSPRYVAPLSSYVETLHRQQGRNVRLLRLLLMISETSNTGHGNLWVLCKGCSDLFGENVEVRRSSTGRRRLL